MKELAKMVLGEKWLDYFDVGVIKEKEGEYVVELVEKKEQKPEEGENIVCNGFYNPVEIIDFPVRGKVLFLKFSRRRWRDNKTGKDYVNTYEFHKPGMKVGIEFALFLKENNREEISKLFIDVAHAWDLLEEDFQMVQRGAVRIP